MLINIESVCYVMLIVCYSATLTVMADLPTKILDFRGFDSSILPSLRGGIPRSIGDYPGDFESRSLSSREDLRREIGRAQECTSRRPRRRFSRLYGLHGLGDCTVLTQNSI